MEIVIKKPTVPGAEKQGCERPPMYRGKPGPQGPAGTIEIAQVVTIEPSDPARVENIGDSTNAKLILYIPKGDPGNRGEPGPAVEITEEIVQAVANEIEFTPEKVGLGNVDNTSDMDKPISKAQEDVLFQLAIGIADHVGSTNNPHNVTIEQIGAAPAGYGLGVKSSEMASISDADDATDNGWYRMASSTANGINASAGLFVIANENRYITQFVIQTSTGYILRRQCINGTWGEWEWEKPPMTLGVEYRTTERWNGKVVYTKLVNYGGMPAQTTWAVAHGCAATNILRHCAVNETQGMPIPNNVTSIVVDKTNITITNSTPDLKNNQCRVQLWYTKD